MAVTAKVADRTGCRPGERVVERGRTQHPWREESKGNKDENTNSNNTALHIIPSKSISCTVLATYEGFRTKNVYDSLFLPDRNHFQRAYQCKHLYSQ